MKKKLTFLQILGVSLILCGALLFLFSHLRAARAQQEMRAVTQKITALLPEPTPGIPGTYADPSMTVLEINGNDYVALLDIPAFGRTLPVSAHWEEKNLAQCPSRFWGSCYEDILVIGGNDQSGQFDFCDQIHPGAAISVTAMNGEVFRYTVERIDRSKHAQNQWLMQGEYDLTLFARGELSLEYIAVRCVLK